jgi:hypothetical protein
MSEFASESLQIVDNQKNNEINIIETPKKKRGRPKKEKNDKVVKDKKPRGRPRKKDVIDYGSDSEQILPKKEPTLTEIILRTQKRKRGRPTKRNVINIIGWHDDEGCLYVAPPTTEELILSQIHIFDGYIPHI